MLPCPRPLQLKKLIKKVSNELSSLGLNPVVLNRLLTPPDVAAAGHAPTAAAAQVDSPSRSSASYVHPSESPSESSSTAAKRATTDSPAVDELEFEFLSEGSSSVAETEGSAAADGHAEAAHDDDGGREGRERSVQRWVDETGKRFRVRVREERSDRSESAGGESGLSLADDEEDDDPARLRRHRTRRSSGVKREAISVKGGFTAEYEIGGASPLSREACTRALQLLLTPLIRPHL